MTEDWTEAEDVTPIILPPSGCLMIRFHDLIRPFAHSGDQAVLGFILDRMNGHPITSQDPIRICSNLYYYMDGYWRRTSSGALVEMPGC